MKKKIVILGSTGSIGKSTLEVIKKDKKNFEIVLLTANNNYKKLIQQAKQFNAKNVLIKNHKYYLKVKKSLKKTKVYYGNISLKKIVKKKIDYTMSAIVGIAGLQPTVDAIQISKSIAIANKESIICGWDIISKQINKYKTKLLPVDSEHFSIMELTKNLRDDDVKEIIITASGGPFLNIPKKKLNNIKPKQAIKHPNWKMGKKISVDSANLMNKVFEVIEASKIFNFNSSKYKIMIHPQSYVHSIIRFSNGLIKMILYDTDMKIPISNTLYGRKNNFSNVKKIDAKILNKLTFQNVNKKKFPSINLINKCLTLGALAPTIVNASNEVLVNLFLSKKIRFLDIVKTIEKIISDKDFKKYATRKPISIKDIKISDNWARLKTLVMCVR
tara:strand:- start:5732 stop:6892 length:1161 start_codon:yes stop_codon:yes gene_type:complete